MWYDKIQGQISKRCNTIKISVVYPANDQTQTKRFIANLRARLGAIQASFPDSFAVFSPLLDKADELHEHLLESRSREHVLAMSSFADLAI